MPYLFSKSTVLSSVFIDLPEMRSNSANKFFDGLAPTNNDGHKTEEGEETTKNERGPAKGETEKQAIATEKQKVTVQVGNGKCGSETATKLEAPMAEFMKFARNIDTNEVGEFIDKQTGDVLDVAFEVKHAAL